MKKIIVIGSLNIDFVVDVDRMPVVGETVLAKGFELIPGGKGANQAYAAGKLGAEVTMLGAVGNDAYGDRLCESLKSAGVRIDHLKRLDGVSTGIALITVNGEGDNSIIVVQGANKAVDREYIDSKLDLLRECDIVIFQLEIPLDTVTYAAQKAKEYGKTVILDPAPAVAGLPEELLRSVDIIKPNATELEILTGSGNATNDLKRASDIIKARGVKNVLVTLGGQGAFLNDCDGNARRFYTQDVKVIDTTAAGDSFTAAVAVSLAKGEELASAIEFADKVATIVVTRKGAQSSVPSIQEVEEYIGQLK